MLLAWSIFYSLSQDVTSMTHFYSLSQDMLLAWPIFIVSGKICY